MKAEDALFRAALAYAESTEDVHGRLAAKLKAAALAFAAPCVGCGNSAVMCPSFCLAQTRPASQMPCPTEEK